MPSAPDDLTHIKAAASSLIEHFDSVHVFATRHEPGEEDGTIHVSFGLGNWFARKGQIREWLIKEEEVSRVGARRSVEEG